jgi:hypothetical protein
VACSVGRGLYARAERDWLWKGRRVSLFDRTTVTMPDTRENQAAYPQVYNQKPGFGFPIARIEAVISLACGAVVNLGFCQYAGKGQGEVSLLRRLWDVLRPVMAQAAARHGIAPRTISFTGAMQTLEAFQPLLEFGAAQDAAGRLRLCHDLLDAIATHRVGNRPDRYEPRVKKRRRNH